jgi:pimeloyl-ACP methyl ester carboxylesterase
VNPACAYDRTGAGEPLVLIHGLGSRRQIWAPVVPALSERHDVIAVDLPGFGDSSVGTGSSITHLISAVTTLVDELGLQRPHLAGNSMGGGIALELGRRGLAASVTAFSPIGFWKTPGRIWTQQALGGERRLGAKIRPAIPRLLATTAGRGALTGLVFGRPSRLGPSVVIDDIDALIAAPGFEQAAASFTGHRFAGVGQLADIPTTVAWGSRDLLLTYATQHRRARAAIPTAHHVTLRSCGHTPFYDDPQLCVRTILDTTTGVHA